MATSDTIFRWGRGTKKKRFTEVLKLYLPWCFQTEWVLTILGCLNELAHEPRLQVRRGVGVLASRSCKKLNRRFLLRRIIQDIIGDETKGLTPDG